MRIAYADPPYPGQARSRYGCREVNHEFLVRDLVECFPDGWALSTSSTALRAVLPLCPKDVRVAAWVKAFARYKPKVRPCYAWEPVIFRAARKEKRHSETTPFDWIECLPDMTTTIGAKPPIFCHWLFQILGLRPGDEIVDLFPGTGAVGYAWNSWCRQLRLFE